MSPRIKKILLLVLAAALLFGTSRIQRGMNHDRDRLGLTHIQPLENAPPVLAFTTVALGGFRGLISNMLWIRAAQLQEEDKFFEAVQLSDWITKLEPHFSQVWVHEAWNMAFNISVKFKGTEPGVYPDRWRWVRRGIELLRDEGLVYNPDDVLIHRELAWLFQFKLGATLDDANAYYKKEWLKEMKAVLGPDGAGFDELINPKTDDQKQRAALLKSKYKMDPVLMKKLDEEFGPMEWRLPEAHAVYWAAEGLQKAKEHPNRVNPDDLIQLRRSIYQSMQLSFQRGRLEPNPFGDEPRFGPNLDIIPKVIATYEKQMSDDESNRDVIQRGHRNLLRQVIYTLYVNNRIGGPDTNNAAYWFKYLGDKYPDKPIIDDRPNSLPRNVTLDEYAFACVQVDINETSPDRVKAAVEGMVITSFGQLILGQRDRAAAFMGLANKIRETYRAKIPAERWTALEVPPVSEISRFILTEMLKPDSSLPPAARAILQAETGFRPENAASTNSISPSGAPH